MKRIPQRIILFLAAVLLACAAAPAQTVAVVREGLEIRPYPTAAQGYERASNVVLVDLRAADEGAEAAVFTVVKAFKGNLKPGDALPLRDGADYSENWIGQRWLFYLEGSPGRDGIWPKPGIIRSLWLDRRIEGDLLFLNRIKKVQGKTRISGRVEQWLVAPDDYFSFDRIWQPLAARRVRITGQGKDIVLRTDANGYYEIYGLASGRYKIKPDPLPGLTQMLEARDASDGSFERELAAGAHVEQHLQFKIDNTVAGRVVDVTGRPVKGVSLNLKPADGSDASADFMDATTADDGTFEFRSVPALEYVIVANEGFGVTREEPYGAFYYPAGRKRSDAVEFYIGAGQRLDGLVMYAPPAAEFVKISGILLNFKGEPAKGRVYFHEDGEGRGWSLYAHADGEGRFSMDLQKGMRGKISATVWVPAGECIECSPPDDLQNGERYVINITSQLVSVEGAEDRADVELKLPPPSCRVFPLMKMSTTH